MSERGKESATVTEELFNKMVANLLQMVRAMFKMKGQLMPVALLLYNTDKPEIAIMPAPWIGVPKLKSACIDALKLAARELDAYACALVNEAWLLQVKVEGGDFEAAQAETRSHGPDLSKHPESVEVVLVNTEFRAEVGPVQARMYVGMIQRPEDTKPFVDKFELQKSDELHGRLIGIIEGDRTPNSQEMQ
jgi:hypothetical protein